MKILVASVDFAPHNDGVSTLSTHYARRLAERGHAVSVVGPQDPGAAAGDAAAPFGTRRFRGYALGLLRGVPFAFCLLREIRTQRPDLVLAMNIGYGGLLCSLLPRWMGVRYITMAYAYEFLKVRHIPPLRALYLHAYRRSECTIAISRYTRDRLVEFGVASGTVHVIEPGAELPLGDATAAYRDGAGPFIGTCGRLIRRKGHDLVIRALPHLVKTFPDLCYLVAGTGPAAARLEALAQELGVRANVRFLGRLGNSELAGFYRSLDLFVMPARGGGKDGHVEGFGIVYLEAALCGVPSVGARTGGVPEAIVEGVTGRLIESGSIDPLAAAVEELLRAPAELETMGRAATLRAEQEYGWDRQVDRVNALLSSLQLEEN